MRMDVTGLGSGDRVGVQDPDPDPDPDPALQLSQAHRRLFPVPHRQSAPLQSQPNPLPPHTPLRQTSIL